MLSLLNYITKYLILMNSSGLSVNAALDKLGIA